MLSTVYNMYRRKDIIKYSDKNYKYSYPKYDNVCKF